MPIALARILLTAVTAYLGSGLIFAVLNVVGGLRRIDSAAAGTGVGARLLLVPGMALLWPIFLPRWIRGLGERPAERTAHRRAEVRT
jgi:hypothetical protein